VNRKPRSPEETYKQALRKAQIELPNRDPHVIEAAAAVQYHETSTEAGTFRVQFLSDTYAVHWPTGAVSALSDTAEADVATRIILLHYLLTADGMPLAGEWISFRNLPGGLGYYGAFQNRASLRLASAFGSRPSALEVAAKALGGERLAFGDASFLFRALPRVWLAVVLYTADEEFPAAGNILFDGSASHYLPTEDLAVLGGILASRLVKAAPQAK
jgi:hypothetical protein